MAIDGQADMASLVQPQRVHRRAFVDPHVFAEEQRRIFSSTWVYVGHESEVEAAGSFKATTLGVQPVLLTRDTAGALHVLVNACRHRGVRLADDQTRGCTRHLVCPYHGWTFELSGRLVSVPMRDRQASDFSEERLGLIGLRVDSYRGFVFATFNRAAPTLVEHLGAAARYLDLFADLSPTGKIRLESGVTKYQFKGNWKQQVENSMDGYHPAIVHHSFFEDVLKPRVGRGMGFIVGPDSPAKNVALGHGHALLDFSMFDRKGMLGAAKAQSEVEWHEKVRVRLSDRPDYAEEVIRCNGGDGFNLLVYPNLVLINNQVRVIHPLTYDTTEVYAYPATLEDVAPQINTVRIRAHEDFYGPASFGAPDDIEMFQRQWDGMVRSTAMEWLCYDRGAEQETPLGGDGRESHIADETAHRGIWRRWAELMAEPSSAPRPIAEAAE